MKITILCSDMRHPINIYLQRWAEDKKNAHDVCIARNKNELLRGDILFLVSCSEIIGLPERSQYRATLVLHASGLPRGRGWSPHIWQIIEGAKVITLSLLEAEDKVDSGKIWAQVEIPIPGDALWDEVNNLLFSSELQLLDYAIENFYEIIPMEQNQKIEPSYYPRRRPVDSEIDPNLSISSQFDLIRISDPVRFPAFFFMRGYKYKITLEKINN